MPKGRKSWARTPEHYAKGHQLADHKPAARQCLRCGKMFVSKGPGNRICAKCAEANRSVYQCRGER